MSDAPHDDLQAWNEAYGRLVEYLDTFALGDRAQVTRLALTLLDEAKEAHQRDASQHPTTLTLSRAQAKITAWLRAALADRDQADSRVLSAGSIAVLISRVAQTRPGSFLATPLPDEVRQSLRQALVLTGPDMEFSSMTPRPLDYGPMLDLARQTWHRFDLKTFVSAVCFWIGVYFIVYWWLSEYL
jgi:hypothetical protein